jgi:sterol desaturase/sphingolipid hydroxylase (fatty acid hydroxylase superfamily)
MAAMEATRRTDILKASPRMFDNELLDKLSRVHPVVPVLIFVPAIVVLLVLAIESSTAALGILGLFVGGYLFWTLSEYWIHRVIFHFEPEQGFGARLHWIIHGVHHDHPNDPLRLVMPPSVSVPLSSLFCLGFYAVFGTPLWYAFGAGFLAGYLLYDMTHYYLHHHRPKWWLGKRLRELHMRHHFQDDTVMFGISSPYWDHVFRTARREYQKPKQAGRTPA